MLPRLSKPSMPLCPVVSNLNTQTLIVEIKIKDKLRKNITLENIWDSDAIDKEIKWFLSNNNLKPEAFGFIKSVVTAKIEEKKTRRTLIK